MVSATNLRKILGVSEDKFELIAPKVDAAISELQYFDALNQYERPRVKKTLSQLSKLSENLGELLGQVLFLLADDEPSYHFASRLIHLNHPEKGDDAQQQMVFMRLIKDLRDMKSAADRALENPHIRSTTKNIRETYYVEFIIELESAYATATGKQTGRGEQTDFVRFVKACFALGGRPVESPKSYIYKALGRAKK